MEQIKLELTEEGEAEMVEVLVKSRGKKPKWKKIKVDKPDDQPPHDMKMFTAQETVEVKAMVDSEWTLSKLRRDITSWYNARMVYDQKGMRQWKKEVVISLQKLYEMGIMEFEYDGDHWKTDANQWWWREPKKN